MDNNSNVWATFLYSTFWYKMFYVHVLNTCKIHVHDNFRGFLPKYLEPKWAIYSVVPLAWWSQNEVNLQIHHSGSHWCPAHKVRVSMTKSAASWLRHTCNMTSAFLLRQAYGSAMNTGRACCCCLQPSCIVCLYHPVFRSDVLSVHMPAGIFWVQLYVAGRFPFVSPFLHIKLFAKRFFPLFGLCKLPCLFLLYYIRLWYHLIMMNFQTD